MIYRFSLVLGVLVALYFAAFGVFYLAGYRVYRVPTNAMQPTIQKNERCIGRLSENYRTEVQRFDLVIYTLPEAPGEIHVKRAVGLPGEKIVIDNHSVSINDKRLALPSAMSTGGFRLKQSNLVIPADAIFVLGDYTDNSADSRYFGPVPLSRVVGRLVFKK